MRATPIITLSEPPARGIALLEHGFRPFFLLAGGYGALSLAAWIATFTGWLPLSTAWPAVIWHGHEMVYGFAAAGLAGFMLTAVPNWTGAGPLRGGRLLALTLVWLAGRLALWNTAHLPGWAVALADLAFLPALAAAVGGSLIHQARKNGPRNLVFLVLLTALWSGNLITHLASLGLLPEAALTGLHLGIDVLLLAITVVGGRIVPSFTTNALRAGGAKQLPRSFAWLDRVTILSMVTLAVTDAVLGSGRALGLVALLAAVAQALRLAYWRPWATLRNPLLWVLHLGYGWLVLGLLLLALSGLTELLPPTAALHALTAGAIGTMLVAVMSRAALGHTGRALTAPPAIVAAYVALSLAAALRVGAPLVTDAVVPWLAASGLLWAGAMAVFTIVYAPILLLPRAGRV